MRNGFPPGEISVLLNRTVVEEHADEAAFLWGLRDRAVNAPHYRLAQLALLDARLTAHLEGLRIAGETGLDMARRALADTTAGSLFVFAFLAFAMRDREAMQHALAIATTDGALKDGFVSALAWQEPGQLEPLLRPLAASSRAAHRRLALGVRAAQRSDPGPELSSCARDSDARLRARALRCIGELHRTDLEPVLRAAMADPDANCRFWAAWSLALRKDSLAAETVLEVAMQCGMLPDALEITMRTREPDKARRLIRSLAADAASMRSAVAAAGAFGDPATVPWLLELCDDDTLARPAAEAFALITGADLELPALRRDPPEESEQACEADRDSRWVSADGLRQWWREQRDRYSAGCRFVGGLPAGRAAAMRLLRDGTQRQRRSAAVELAICDQGVMLFPVAARADWQRRQLAV